MEFVQYTGFGVLFDQKWRKSYQYWDTSMFQHVVLENYGFGFFYQGLNWRLFSFKNFLDGTVFYSVP